MGNSNNFTEQYRELQDIMHIVTQVEKLRINIYNKLQNKRYPNQDVLNVLADAMEEVAEITKIHPQKKEEMCVYTELRSGRIATDLCDRILRWQKETLNWVDHMESRRQIQILQEEVHRQGELIQQLMDKYNV